MKQKADARWQRSTAGQSIANRSVPLAMACVPVGDGIRTGGDRFASSKMTALTADRWQSPAAIAPLRMAATDTAIAWMVEDRFALLGSAMETFFFFSFCPALW